MDAFEGKGEASVQLDHNELSEEQASEAEEEQHDFAQEVSSLSSVFDSK